MTENNVSSGSDPKTATISEELRQAADRLKAAKIPNEALAKLLTTFASTIDRTPEKVLPPLALEIARRVNAWEATA